MALCGELMLLLSCQGGAFIDAAWNGMQRVERITAEYTFGIFIGDAISHGELRREQCMGRQWHHEYLPHE